MDSQAEKVPKMTHFSQDKPASNLIMTPHSNLVCSNIYIAIAVLKLYF